MQKRESSCLGRDSIGSYSNEPFNLRDSESRKNRPSRLSQGKKKSPFNPALSPSKNKTAERPEPTTINPNPKRTPFRGREGIKSKSPSSNSRKSIVVNRRSTDGEFQEVSGFAAHMAQFVQNFFACCGGNQELDKTFRASNASSNVLAYSFVADPYSPQQNKGGRLFNHSLGQNPLEDFKGSFKSFKSVV